MRRKIFSPIFMNICWFLFGWGLLEDFFLWVLLLVFSSWVSKSSLGILRGVEVPGLLFLFGVGMLGGLVGVAGSTVLPVTLGVAFWLGFFKNVGVGVYFGVAGSPVPPAT